jgi:hypothetical protein
MMADEASKETPLTLQYESPGTARRSGDQFGWAIVLIMFAVMSWIAFMFVLMLTTAAPDVRMSGRRLLAGIFISALLAAITTIVAHRLVIRLRR